MNTITIILLQTLISNYCKFSDLNIDKNTKIDCLTKAVNCIIIEDGSKIYKTQVKKCLK